MPVIGFIVVLVNLLLSWLVENTAMLMFELLDSIFELVLFGPDIFSRVPVADELFDGFRAVGISLVVLVTMYQALKSYMAFYGIEAEEPWKILVKSGIFMFMVLESKEFVIFVLEMYRSLIDGLLVLRESMSADVSFMDAITGIWTLKAFVLIYMCFKLFLTAFRFAERYALNILMCLLAPMAMACGVAAPSKPYFVGWLRVFLGNMLVQVMHVLGFILCVKFFQGDANFGNELFGYVLVVATLQVLDRAEDFVNQVSTVSAGFGAYFDPKISDQIKKISGDIQGTFEGISSIGKKP